MNRGVFIAGTDSDVGKTMISIGMAAMLKKRGVSFTIMKPISLGEFISDDARYFIESLGLHERMDLINPINFKEKVVPYIATTIEQRDIDFKKLLSAFETLQSKYSYVITEGLGGVLIPLSKNVFMTDLIKLFDLPVIIVSRTSFDAINHTLLTLRVLREEGIHVDGIIMNGYGRHSEAGFAEDTNPETIEEFSNGIPVLAVVEYKPEYKSDFGFFARDLEEQSRLTAYIDKITTLVGQSIV